MVEHSSVMVFVTPLITVVYVVMEGAVEHSAVIVNVRPSDTVVYVVTAPVNVLHFTHTVLVTVAEFVT